MTFDATLNDATDAYPQTPYEDGMEAFDGGYTDCPYQDGEDADKWWEGWHTAEALEANGA